jgi:hypothetical protein
MDQYLRLHDAPPPSINGHGPSSIVHGQVPQVDSRSSESMN